MLHQMIFMKVLINFIWTQLHFFTYACTKHVFRDSIPWALNAMIFFRKQFLWKNIFNIHYIYYNYIIYTLNIIDARRRKVLSVFFVQSIVQFKWVLLAFGQNKCELFLRWFCTMGSHLLANYVHQDQHSVRRIYIWKYANVDCLPISLKKIFCKTSFRCSLLTWLTLAVI